MTARVPDENPPPLLAIFAFVVVVGGICLAAMIVCAGLILALAEVVR